MLAALLIATMIVPTVGAQPVSEEVGPFSGAEMPEELANNVRQVDPYTFVCGGHVSDKKAFVAEWEPMKKWQENKERGLTLEIMRKAEPTSQPKMFLDPTLKEKRISMV
ncbi:MAG: hypothetical protein ACT6FD_07330 [Methanosarcinaceae archaeon]